MNVGLFAGAVAIGAACAGFGVPIDFVLFGLTLVGVALFHKYVLQVALLSNYFSLLLSKKTLPSRAKVSLAKPGLPEGRGCGVRLPS